MTTHTADDFRAKSCDVFVSYKRLDADQFEKLATDPNRQAEGLGGPERALWNLLGLFDRTADGLAVCWRGTFQGSQTPPTSSPRPATTAAIPSLPISRPASPPPEPALLAAAVLQLPQ